MVAWFIRCIMHANEVIESDRARNAFFATRLSRSTSYSDILKIGCSVGKNGNANVLWFILIRLLENESEIRRSISGFLNKYIWEAFIFDRNRQIRYLKYVFGMWVCGCKCGLAGAWNGNIKAELENVPTRLDKPVRSIENTYLPPSIAI